MSLRGCFIPLVVRLCGVPNDERLAQMSDAIARTVASRLGAADRVIAVREGWPVWRKTHAAPRIRFSGAPLDNDLRQRVVAAIEAGITRAVTGAPAAGRPAPIENSNVILPQQSAGNLAIQRQPQLGETFSPPPSTRALPPLGDGGLDDPGPQEEKHRVVLYLARGHFGRSARAYFDAFYSDYEAIPLFGATFEDILLALNQRVQLWRRQTKRRVYLDKIVLIAHAKVELRDERQIVRFTDIPLLRSRRGDRFDAFSAEQLLTDLFLNPDKHTQFRAAREGVASAVDDRTEIQVRACNVGDDPALMRSLQIFFGGQANVLASRGYWLFEVVPIAPYTIFKTLDDAIHFLEQRGQLRSHNLEEQRHEVQQLIGRFGGRFGGIPTEFFIYQKTPTPPAFSVFDDLDTPGSESVEEKQHRLVRLKQAFIAEAAASKAYNDATQKEQLSPPLEGSKIRIEGPEPFSGPGPEGLFAQAARIRREKVARTDDPLGGIEWGSKPKPTNLFQENVFSDHSEEEAYAPLKPPPRVSAKKKMGSDPISPRKSSPPWDHAPVSPRRDITGEEINAVDVAAKTLWASLYGRDQRPSTAGLTAKHREMVEDLWTAGSYDVAGTKRLEALNRARPRIKTLLDRYRRSDLAGKEIGGQMEQFLAAAQNRASASELEQKVASEMVDLDPSTFDPQTLADVQMARAAVADMLGSVRRLTGSYGKDLEKAIESAKTDGRLAPNLDVPNTLKQLEHILGSLEVAFKIADPAKRASLVNDIRNFLGEGPVQEAITLASLFNYAVRFLQASTAIVTVAAAAWATVRGLKDEASKLLALGGKKFSKLGNILTWVDLVRNILILGGDEHASGQAKAEAARDILTGSISLADKYEKLPSGWALPLTAAIIITYYETKWIMEEVHEKVILSAKGHDLVQAYKRMRAIGNDVAKELYAVDRMLTLMRDQEAAHSSRAAGYQMALSAAKRTLQQSLTVAKRECAYDVGGLAPGHFAPMREGFAKLFARPDLDNAFLKDPPAEIVLMTGTAVLQLIVDLVAQYDAVRLRVFKGE